MKIAIISDIHDNLTRWEEVAKIIKAEKIEIGICCGDVTSIDTLEEISRTFKNLYIALGNADYDIKVKTGLIPENVIWSEDICELNIDKLKIGIVHNNHAADQLAATKKHDVIFYGHTHTPWEKIVDKTLLLNPGEISGRYGKASFAVFEIKKKTAELIIID